MLGPAGCGKELGLGAGNRCNQFLNIRGSRFVGLFPMTTVEYTGDPFSIRNLSSLKESLSQNFAAERTNLPEKGESRQPIESTHGKALMFSGKLARPREHPQGSCLPQTTDSTLRFTLPEGLPVLTWPDLNLGPGAPSPPLCCWSRGRRLAALNKTKFSAYLR